MNKGLTKGREEGGQVCKSVFLTRYVLFQFVLVLESLCRCGMYAGVNVQRSTSEGFLNCPPPHLFFEAESLTEPATDKFTRLAG